MGGRGSGRRWHNGAKGTTEGSRPLDIRKLRRAGVLTPGRWCSWEWTVGGREVASIQVQVEAQHVLLYYRHRCGKDADWQNVEQQVQMAHSACTYGGTRPWWLCPSCGRRVAILYGPGKLYACRHCYHLAYASQRETDYDRALRRANTIRRRLGWQAGFLNGKGWKPKGMRWRTFERLNHEHDVLVGVSLAGMAQSLGIKPIPMP